MGTWLRSWKQSRLSLAIIAVYAFLGMFNAIIANDQPLLAKTQNSWVFPAFQDLLFDWGLADHEALTNQEQPFQTAIYPPIRYKAGTLDAQYASFLSPLQGIAGGHYLGTDQLGRDVAAGVVRGCYTSFRIGLLATLLCAILGVSLGLFMGYFGNNGIQVNLSQCVFIGVWLFFSIYFMVYPPHLGGWLLLFAILFWLATLIAILILLQRAGKTNIGFPLDALLNRIIALRRSIPTLILLLVLFPLFAKPEVNNVILVILILGWTSFARHARAETLSVKERDYVTAARIMGSGHLAILYRHILPNILPTLLLLGAMNFAGNVLLESTLSFLGMGLPPEEVSWGSLLSEGRKNPYAWWLVVFPGFVLFVLVFTINQLTYQYLEKDA